MNGPFPLNKSDRDIFKTKELMDKILDGKKAIVERIYKGIDKIPIQNSLDCNSVLDFKYRARASWESIKSFHVMKQCYHQGLAKHWAAFDALLIICAMQLDQEYPLWDVYTAFANGSIL